MSRRVILWVITVLWAVMIFSFSAQPKTESAEVSDSVTEKVLNIVPDIRSMPQEEKSAKVDKFDPYIRKIAHLTLYTILGILVIALLQTYSISIQKSFLLAFFICVIYAASDELHQYFVPGRSAEFLDVCIDSAGSLLGLILFLTIKRLSQQKA